MRCEKNVGAAGFFTILPGVQHRIFCIGPDDNRVAADSDRVIWRRAQRGS